LIPGVDAAALGDLAERVRVAVGNRTIPTEAGQIRVTASFGLTCLSEGETEIVSAVSRADSALYQAKTLGRNRVAWQDMICIPCEPNASADAMITAEIS
jgi:diguanylate cyclase (GGDEF)-like protein